MRECSIHLKSGGLASNSNCGLQPGIRKRIAVVMNDDSGDPLWQEKRFRNLAAGMAVLGLWIFFAVWKLNAWGLAMIPGSSIWLFWICRAVFPRMHWELRRIGWTVSAVWHWLLVLPFPLYLMVPGGLLIFAHSIIALAISISAIRHDRPAWRLW